MFDKLEALEERFQLVSEKISDPDIIADQESWRKYCKEHSDLTPIIDKYRELKSAKQTVADDKEMLEAGQDKEFEEMIRLEMAEAEETIERASEELKILLLPKDPNDEKNVIMEIRGGTGVYLLRKPADYGNIKRRDQKGRAGKGMEGSSA